MSRTGDDEKAIERHREGISPVNRDTFCRFLVCKEVSGCKVSTRRHYASTLARFDQYINGRAYVDATADEVSLFLLGLGKPFPLIWEVVG